MKTTSILITLCVFLTSSAIAQKVKHPKINNLKGALILVKNDKPQERFSMEANLGKLFSSYGMPILLSVNLIKEGASLSELAETKIQAEMNARNINSVLVISVRGFDTRFKPRTKIPATLEEMLKEGNLNPISVDEASSVTIEFFQYVNGKFYGYHMQRLGGASSRPKVYSRLQKRLDKLVPRWQK
jgi:hypothetical protein